MASQLRQRYGVQGLKLSFVLADWNINSTPLINMGKPPNLYSYSSVDDLAPQLRAFVLSAQNAGIEHHGSFRVGVSGGSLPNTLAKALLAPGNGSSEDTVKFGSWDVFFADERAVPLDHPDSNYKLVKEELVDKIPANLGKPNVYPVDVNYLDDTEEMADQYEKLLVSKFAAKDSVKLPIFDLLLLGCGPDGHTCSLFPDHSLLREKAAWVCAIEDSPKSPPKRITLSLPVVTVASKIGFVTTGGSKKEILHQIFDTEEGRALPSGLVNEGGAEKVSWFTDNAAVEGVQFPKRGSL